MVRTPARHCAESRPCRWAFAVRPGIIVLPKHGPEASALGSAWERMRGLDGFRSVSRALLRHSALPYSGCRPPCSSLPATELHTAAKLGLPLHRVLSLHGGQHGLLLSFAFAEVAEVAGSIPLNHPCISCERAAAPAAPAPQLCRSACGARGIACAADSPRANMRARRTARAARAGATSKGHSRAASAALVVGPP